MSFKYLLKFVVGWRFLLILITVIGAQFIPFKDSFPYRQEYLEPYGSPLFYSWGNFDGVHYLGIAQNGYWAQFTQAFFPLYPVLMGWLDKIIHNTLVSGLIISHLSLLGALYFLYELIKLDFDKKIALKTLMLLMIFPTSFYFGAVYSESLFLLLVVTSFYSMRKGHEKEAIILAAFASGVRIVGIFLLPALLYEKFLKDKKKLTFQSIRSYLPFGFASTGLVAYMYYLHRNYSDALYFLHAQSAFGASRSSDRLILLYQVIFRYGKMFLTTNVQSWLFYTVSLEFWISMGFLALLVVAWRKKIRLSYLIFSAGAYILPTLTGTFSSMPRYVLVLFPCFMALSLVVKGKLLRVLYIVSVILLITNTLLFTRGYWVA